MKKKRKNKYIVLLLLLIGIGKGYAQESLQKPYSNYPDTLILKTDTNNEVIFSFNRISQKKEYLTDDLWKSTVSIMETAVSNTELDEGLLVTYRKDEKGNGEIAKVEVSQLEKPSDIYVIGGDEILQKSAERIEFRLHYDQVLIHFSVNELAELEEIKALDIESVWSQIDMKFKNQGRRNLYSGTGEIKYGKANINKIEGNSHGLDHIELSAGVGLGFYRDRWVPDFGFKIAINMPDRLGNPRLQFGTLYTQHYFFNQEAEGDFNLDINGFLSGFVSHQFLPKYELGLAFGTLIHRDGDFYQGGTYKLSVYTQKNESKVSFTPEIIFTNDFKDAFPAIKFGLSF